MQKDLAGNSVAHTDAMAPVSAQEQVPLCAGMVRCQRGLSEAFG